jgi:hypothetical protein
MYCEWFYTADYWLGGSSLSELHRLSKPLLIWSNRKVEKWS